MNALEGKVRGTQATVVGDLGQWRKGFSYGMCELEATGSLVFKP